MDAGNRALIEAWMRKQVPGLFGNVQTSTEPPRQRPFSARAAESSLPASIMNAFTNLSEQIVDGAVDAATLPRDVLRGGYSLPPRDAPGLSEDDAYNVYRNGKFIGNRLANQEELLKRTFGLGSYVTGSNVAATGLAGRTARDPNILRMGGGRRRVPLHKRSTSTIDEFTSEIANVLKTGRSSTGKLFREDLGEMTIDLGVPGDLAKRFKGGWGLSHIRDKRYSEGIDGDAFVHTILPVILSSGKLSFAKTPGGRRSAILEFGEYEAALRLQRHDKRETWLLTSFKKKRPGAP